MLDPLDYENRSYFFVLARKRRAAFFSLLLERVSYHFWRLFFWFLLFCGLWMLEVPQFFGDWGPDLGWIAFVFGSLVFLQDIASFRWPTREQVDRRLEQSSAVLTGQLAALDDQLANPRKPITRDLWQVAQEQILKILPSLKIPFPRAIMVRQDPRGFRFAVVLLLVIGLLVSGPDWDQRLINGFFPFHPEKFLSQSAAKPKSIDLWITPPAYTGLGRLHLQGSGHHLEKLRIPEGSIIKVRLRSKFGYLFHPYLLNGEKKEKLKALGENLYEIESPIRSGKALTLKQFFIPRGWWDYEYVQDQSPSITADDKEKLIEILPNGQIRFSFKVQDDYSVQDLIVRMRLDDMVAQKPLGDPYQETRLVMSPAGESFGIQPVYDLTWHTWAGLQAVFDFEVRDHHGHTASLGPVTLTLPERNFRHPLAAKLIALRKKLAWNPDADFTPLALELESYLSRPDLFQYDIQVFLGLRSAASRLYYIQISSVEDSVKTVKSVMALLWDIAIDIEDGDMSMAMRGLRDAQKALENALRNPDTSKEELSQLMEDLREQMAQYFMELQRELQKRMAAGEQFPQLKPEDLQKAITPEAFSSFLDQMEAMMRSDEKESAQTMLSQLQRLLDKMDPSMMQSLPDDMQMMKEGVSRLQEMIERQQDLLEHTQKHDGKKEDLKNSQAQQESLRKDLGQLMMDAGEKLDTIPEDMGKADQEMRSSEKELGQGNASASVPHQEKSLEHLKNAQDQLGQQFGKRMEQMAKFGTGDGRPLDPLGRPYEPEDGNGRSLNSRVQIPDESQRKQVNEILDVLRRRSGEFYRPDQERDYYHRLLRQF